MEGYYNDPLDYTNVSWNKFYDAVDSDCFDDNDSIIIYNTLDKKMKLLSFGDYLKRYIYIKAGLVIPFEKVLDSEYQQIIMLSFQENYTPASFEPNTAKLSALSKNWITQKTVNRNVVFLLGFGLSMSVDDVNEFLTKALHEHQINAKSPFEVICWYCYKNKCGYQKFKELWNKYNISSANLSNSSIEFFNSNYDLHICEANLTSDLRKIIIQINDEDELLEYASELKAFNNSSRYSVTARNIFDQLYEKAKEKIVKLYNDYEEKKSQEEVEKYKCKLLDNDRISDEEKQLRIERKKANRKVYTIADITESDFEKIISNAIPVDKHGNLKPSKFSTLNEQFFGKKISRQHLREIIDGKVDVSRFDLITLNFFVYSQSIGEYSNRYELYTSFFSSTDDILKKCFGGGYCISNPYECFVLMCILSEEPLGTYSDVWEQSYSS